MLAAHRIAFFESPLLTVVTVLGAMLLGLVAGSACHRVAWRMAHGYPAFGGGVSCHSCSYELSFRERIPLFGWLMMRGTCPRCGAALGVDGPASAILGSLMFASIVLRHGVSLQAFEVLALVCVLLVAALVSLWEYRIPNSCIVAALAIRLVYLVLLAVTGQPVVDLFVSSLVGGLALGLPLALAVYLSNAMLAREVTGMGTVKLVAVVGVYLGWQQGLLALFAACMLAALVWVVSPAKLLDVEVEGGAHRKSPEEAAEFDRSMRNMRATYEEDIAEPMRLIPLAPSVVICLWVMLLLGITPMLWNTPLL